MEIFENSRQINSNNIVDSDVQSMLLPLNLLQNVFFCPKYRIKNDYITPTNLMSNLISSIATLVFIMIYAYRNYLIHFSKMSQLSTAWKYTSYFNGFCYSLGFIMNLVIGIIQSQNSVQFVLTFQNVHSQQRLSGTEKRLCKNVLRMSRAGFSKLRVCGLFYAGAALQLSLIALLADYTIVLLQLAFL
ncbi:uncharacterized protein LOC135118600 [Helicoverpa armigera]|uniref:uncharacterized protein LOC135118600 n=1 Tax=Helicoverpa armigera TaxID=29058 RepID=UPI003082F8E2